MTLFAAATRGLLSRPRERGQELQTPPTPKRTERLRGVPLGVCLLGSLALTSSSLPHFSMGSFSAARAERALSREWRELASKSLLTNAARGDPTHAI